MPVWAFRLGILAALGTLVIAFSAADNGWCTKATATEVAKGEGLGCFEYWLNRYQTLLGGVLALAGAYLAFSAVRSQIGQTERLEQERQRRETRAAQAGATHALDKITNYAAACITLIRDLDQDHLRGHKVPNLPVPSFPTETIAVLQGAVRHSSDDYAARFSDLIATSQIQHARLLGFREKLSKVDGGVEDAYTDLQQNLFDAADLYVRAGALFEYSRELRNPLFADTDAISNALYLTHYESRNWPLIDILLRARYEMAERQVPPRQ